MAKNFIPTTLKAISSRSVIRFLTGLSGYPLSLLNLQNKNLNTSSLFWLSSLILFFSGDTLQFTNNLKERFLMTLTDTSSKKINSKVVTFLINLKKKSNEQLTDNTIGLIKLNLINITLLTAFIFFM